MTSVIQFNFLIIFTLIFIYLFLRILLNTKHDNMAIVKELCLTGLIVSLLYIISFKILPTPNTLTSSININLTPFKIISQLFSQGNLMNTVSFILGNIILFVPLGFFALFCFEGSMKDTLLICLLVAIGVEMIQLLQPLMMTNIDDVFLNMLGGFMGILLSYNFVKNSIRSYR